jgi:hypothetical protein
VNSRYSSFSVPAPLGFIVPVVCPSAVCVPPLSVVCPSVVCVPLGCLVWAAAEGAHAGAAEAVCGGAAAVETESFAATDGQTPSGGVAAVLTLIFHCCCCGAADGGQTAGWAGAGGRWTCGWCAAGGGWTEGCGAAVAAELFLCFFRLCLEQQPARSSTEV